MQENLLILTIGCLVYLRNFLFRFLKCWVKINVENMWYLCDLWLSQFCFSCSLEMFPLFHVRVKCHNHVAVFLFRQHFKDCTNTAHLLCAQICCILGVYFSMKLLRTLKSESCVFLAKQWIWFFFFFSVRFFFFKLTVQCHKLVVLFCLSFCPGAGKIWGFFWFFFC